MKKAYKTRVPLRHDGTSFAVGAVIDADVFEPEHVQRLLALNAIGEVAVSDSEEVLVAVTPNGTEAVDVDDEPIEVTLDVNFSHQELVDDAKDLGLSFRSNISKKALIELIVEEGQAQHFLDQLED